MSVAHIIKGYLHLSETFIAQEIHAMEQAGVALHIYALRRPTDPVTHPQHRAIRAAVTYFPEYLHRPHGVRGAAWHTVPCATPGRIIRRHLLPGFSSHIIASATLSIPGMILGETALSFLGLGLRPPITSWGVLLNEAQNMSVVALHPWLILPVVPVVVVILAFNFFGDGLRDAADPYK